MDVAADVPELWELCAELYICTGNSTGLLGPGGGGRSRGGRLGEIIRQPTHAISEDEAEDLAEPGPLPPTVVLVKAVPREVENVESVAELIKEHLTHVKEADKVTPDVQSEVAELIDGFLEEACLISEMEKLAKKYPRVNNVPRMKVQKLDAEVFQVVEQGLRNTDQTFQAIQKGVLGGMAAIAPLMGLTLMRNTGDKELNRLGSNLVDALHLLAQANNALAARRREVLKPHLSPMYAKVMTKTHEANSDWLYGGDLVETTKQCAAAKRIGDKVLKRKQIQQGRGRGWNQKRFRPPMFPVVGQVPQMQFPMGMRPMNFQNPQFRFPFNQQYPAFGQQQFAGGFPFQKRFRYPKNQQKQGFGKRGATNK